MSNTLEPFQRYLWALDNFPPPAGSSEYPTNLVWKGLRERIFAENDGAPPSKDLCLVCFEENNFAALSFPRYHSTIAPGDPPDCALIPVESARARIRDVLNPNVLALDLRPNAATFSGPSSPVSANWLEAPSPRPFRTAPKTPRSFSLYEAYSGGRDDEDDSKEGEGEGRQRDKEGKEGKNKKRERLLEFECYAQGDTENDMEDESGSGDESDIEEDDEDEEDDEMTKREQTPRFNWNKEYQRAVERWQDVACDPNASLFHQVQCFQALRQVTSDFATTIQVHIPPSLSLFSIPSRQTRKRLSLTTRSRPTIE